MKSSSFKVGDKVMRRDGSMTIDCVAAVRYRYLHEGRPGSYVSHLELVGKENPDDKNGGWPSEEFRLVWSGDRAAR